MVRKLAIGTALVVVLGGVTGAQSASSQAPQLVTTPQVAYRQPLSDSDAANLRAALDAGGDTGRIRQAMSAIQDPIGKKIALWALTDRAPESLSFFEADAARRDLNGWPRGAKRQVTAEKLLETSGLSADRIIAWFGGAQPESPEGALALAGALRASGRGEEARGLIRRWWRDELFDADPQSAMRARFGDYLTDDDHIRRADVLLYGPQGPAARDMVAILPAAYRPVADARMAFRSNASNAAGLLSGLTAQQRQDPGLIFEQASYYRRRGMDSTALSLARGFKAAPTGEVGSRIWSERRAMVVDGLLKDDAQGAYAAARDTGMTVGANAAEAEFYAGWIALSRLKNPKAAAEHFAALAAAGTSPITQGRALYWQGRAAEALGDQGAAQDYYRQGAENITVFYGQLAAQKAGLKQIVLPKDPEITAADRARFEGRELVRALRLLYESGNRDTFRVFSLHVDDTLPTEAECALLVDLIRGYGDTDTAMRAVRTAAQRGMILAERGYPILPSQDVPGGADPAFVLSITRQESNFDPGARSRADARGMMQLLPGTAKMMARALGEPFSDSRLYESDYNMRMGARYLGDMIGNFGGSYIMAAAAYNAGPGRPPQWAAICGDPRGSATDPLDFIECIPFSETRNYVMRTLETREVYRARLNGGTAPLMLWSDLQRGGWRPPVSGTQ
ncbi:MAG: lytic transglycosylase domain-containing protein [Caulobacter sp.]|nr:lytic transglycosylase domain-containing protein [Caulobacter sp.]